ncbi:MAG: GxxExxY protein [Planctomycetota bacterium]
MERGDEIESSVHDVIGAAIEVHRHIGPGQLESVCLRAMEVEPRLRNIPFASESPISMTYQDHAVGPGESTRGSGTAKSFSNLKPTINAPRSMKPRSSDI